MARATWLLHLGSPVIKIALRDAMGFTYSRTLLADTGAGPWRSPFELVLSSRDCNEFGATQGRSVPLDGIVKGRFLLYKIHIEIPELGIVRATTAVAVPPSELPKGLDGIAAFRLLNSFSYGNFGNSAEFGLETK